MKLATYKDGSRDGQLIVVSRDLSAAHYATDIAHRMQQVLDDWNFLSPPLQELYDALNRGKARHAFAFDPAQCMAPMPRGGRWLLADAFDGRAAWSGAAAPDGDAPLAHGPADDFLGMCDTLAPWLADTRADTPHTGLDAQAGLAVLTGEVPRAATPAQTLEAVRLLTLALTLTPANATTPLAASLGPVAVTPDELGPAWQDGRVALSLQMQVNGRRLGVCDAANGMRWSFGDLLAQAARLHRLRTGCLLSSGAVGQTHAPQGCASLGDKRALEQAQDGKPRTPWLHAGDHVRVEMKGRDGQSVFGALSHTLGPAHPTADTAPSTPPPAH